MIIKKLDLLNQLLENGVKPTHPDYENIVASLIKEKIHHEVDRDYVSASTYETVDQKAHDFRNTIKALWISSKVCSSSLFIVIYYFRLKILKKNKLFHNQLLNSNLKNV